MVMKFENALQSFLDHLTIERGLSSNSISAYRRDLAKFSDFLDKEKFDFERLSENEIISFEVWLKGLGMAVTSINRNISALKSFYKYLAQEYSTNNPVSAVVSSKVPRRLPKALTIKEITSLIDSTKRQGDPISLRDHAIIELLYGTGARVSEIVFLNQRGSRLSRQSAWQMISDAADATGLSGKVSPHVFRHSYATHLLDGGADIRVVQELLGHASVTTTQIYTLITIDKVREAYATAHPRAN